MTTPQRQQRQTPPADVGLSGQGRTGPVKKGEGRRVVLDTAANFPTVVQMLAAGITNRAIAEHYKVSPSAVVKFRGRHGAEIMRLRKAVVEAAAAQEALWIADRVDRLAVLQDATEQAVTMLDKAPADRVPELIRTIVAALHEAAEQTGQLPARSALIAQQIVTYRIEGVDMDKL